MGLTRGYTAAIEEHRNRVYGLSYYLVGNREDAEDVTQEVFARLWRDWRRISLRCIPAWLTRVTRNACIDLIRRRRVPCVPIEDAAPLVEEASGGSASVPAETNELRQLVLAAIGKLGEPYRSIVVLREIQQMSYAEISEALELPLNTVRVYLHRGRRELRGIVLGMAVHNDT